MILDSVPYRYQQFISDIAGQDIQVHHGSAKEAISVVRNWLRVASGNSGIPGGMEIHRRYRLFEQELPAYCRKVRLHRDELTFIDLVTIIADWLRTNG